MQHDLTQFTYRLQQVVTIVLTVLGLVLFAFGGSKALSQTNDRRYVEGKKRQQQMIQADILANKHSGNADKPGVIISAISLPEPNAAQKSEPISPSKNQNNKNATPKHGNSINMQQTAQSVHRSVKIKPKLRDYVHTASKAPLTKKQAR
jgi:hypothetical protein